MDNETDFEIDTETDEQSDSAAVLTALGIFAGGALTGVVLMKSWDRIKAVTAEKRSEFAKSRAAKKALKTTV